MNADEAIEKRNAETEQKRYKEFTDHTLIQAKVTPVVLRRGDAYKFHHPNIPLRIMEGIRH